MYVQHLVLTAPARGRRSEIRDVDTDRSPDKSDRDSCVLSIRSVDRPLLIRPQVQWSCEFGGLAVQEGLGHRRLDDAGGTIRLVNVDEWLTLALAGPGTPRGRSTTD